MSDKIYDANNIANYVLRYHESNGYPISNLKLQKELYFLQAEFLVVRNKPLFHNDIVAWDIGPVIPDVYRRFKLFGSVPIPMSGDKKLPWDTYWNGTKWKIDPYDLPPINNMLDTLEQYSSTELMKLTLNQSPWKAAYRPIQLSRNADLARKISNKDLKDFFSDSEPQKEEPQWKPKQAKEKAKNHKNRDEFER